MFVEAKLPASVPSMILIVALLVRPNADVPQFVTVNAPPKLNAAVVVKRLPVGVSELMHILSVLPDAMVTIPVDVNVDTGQIVIVPLLAVALPFVTP